MGEAVVRRVMRAGVLALVLAMPLGLSGCLGDDIWREPFEWRPVTEVGENQDAAAAFAAALASLGDQGVAQGDQVVATAEDLPDNVVFENAKQFLDRQAPGTGTQTQDAVRVVVGTGSDAYVTLTGPAAEAYRTAAGQAVGTVDPVPFEVAERTTRLRWTLDVVLTGQEAPEPGQNPTPAGAFDVRILDPRGAVKAEYHLDTTRQIVDQVIEGTWGGRNEVRQHLGGTWHVEVDANAEGSWNLVVEAYEPELEDWQPWQFWRADRRDVGG